MQSALEQFMEANTATVEVATCPHCTGQGHTVSGLQNGKFAKISGPNQKAFKTGAAAAGYSVTLVRAVGPEEPDIAWFEITQN